MAEVVGVVAAAVQLATACLSLLDLSQKIKGGSQTIQRYEEHLQHLHRLSTAISETPTLQTPEVFSQTQSLLSLVEKNTLSSLLHKGRWSRSLGLLLRDKELQEAFQSIERHKSSLLLVIEHIQSQTLAEIQTDIRTMSSSNSRESYRGASETKRHRHKKSKKVSKNIASTPGPSATSSTVAGKEMETTNNSGVEDHFEEDSDTHFYYGATAGPGALQVNGPSYDYESGEDWAPDVMGIAPAVHVRPTHLGGGEQVNGAHVDYSGKSDGKVVVPKSKLSWEDPTTAQAEVQPGLPPAANQYNGTRVRFRTKKERPEPGTTLVAMTPGHITVDLYFDPERQQYVYVHAGTQVPNTWLLLQPSVPCLPSALPSTADEDVDPTTEWELARWGV